MSSPEIFLNASNTKLLKKIITEHIDKKYDISNIFENENIAKAFEIKKLEISKNLKETDDIVNCNKVFLQHFVPFVYNNIPASVTPNDIVEQFTKENTEKLEGVKIDTTENQPHKKISEKDLDICSADRNEYRSPTSKAMTPYKFDVNLASSETNIAISTQETFKNIIGVNLTHIILADSLTNDLYSINKYSHLFIEIQELNGVYSSTSDHGRKALVKVLRDTSWNEGTSDVRYNLMNTKRTAGNSAVGWYSETPISSLSKLTIRILSPNGYELKSRRDVFEITAVTENPASIQFVCENRFEPGAVQVGNRMSFQVISIENVALGNYLNEGGEFTVEAVNNDQSFTVTKNVESYDENGLPIYQDFAAGTFDVDDYTALNLSMQTSLGLKIKTVETTNFNNYKANLI